jgi:uncharacterized membrane protein
MALIEIDGLPINSMGGSFHGELLNNLMVAQPCKIVFQFSDVLCAKVGLWIGTTHAQRTVGISTAIEMMLGLNGILDDPTKHFEEFFPSHFSGVGNCPILGILDITL